LRFVESRTGSSEIAISRAWLEPVCGFGSRLAGADDRPGEVCLIDLARCVYKKLLAEFGMERKWLLRMQWAAVLQVTLLGVITMVDSWVIDRRVPGVGALRVGLLPLHLRIPMRTARSVRLSSRSISGSAKVLLCG
jgi:hypothetical protein